jgi:hypothetical protein
MAFQEQVTDNRDIFQDTDAVTAPGASGSWSDQVERWIIGARSRIDFKVFMALTGPLSFKDNRQAVDDDIQEAPDHQAQDASCDIQQRRGCL